MKKILMLGTGGTIASEITESGLSPQLTTEQILHYCPDISGFCSVDCLQLCNLDSTNIAPEHCCRVKLPYPVQQKAHCTDRQPKTHQFGDHR